MLPTLICVEFVSLLSFIHLVEVNVLTPCSSMFSDLSIFGILDYYFLFQLYRLYPYFWFVIELTVVWLASFWFLHLMLILFLVWHYYGWVSLGSFSYLLIACLQRIFNHFITTTIKHLVCIFYLVSKVNNLLFSYSLLNFFCSNLDDSSVNFLFW